MEAKIQRNASCEDIRIALSGFGRFSSIEIDKGKDTDGKENGLIFREVGFFKELRQLIFESKENLEEKRKKNRDYLYNFSKERPEIQKLLGSSILDKGRWTAGELREKLKIKTVLIKFEKNNNLLEIPLVSHSKVGVIDAKIYKVKADRIISWETPNVDNFQDRIISDVKSKNENSQKTISVKHEANPDDAQIRTAYQSALSNATGQVVISPIVDFPVDQIQQSHQENAKSSGIQDVYSDDSIRILLEEIDNAIRDNKDITSVTIGRGGGPDENFLPRVVGQRAILDEKKRRDFENQSTNLPPMPDSLKLIKGEMEERLQVKATGLERVSFNKTKLKGVKTCFARAEKLNADVAFLDISSISRRSQKLKKSGLTELARIWDLCSNERFVTKSEVDKIVKDTQTKWNIKAFELPACELPAARVISMERPSVSGKVWNQEKDFFIRHLQNLNGQIVIEIDDRVSLMNGLVEALEELDRRPQGLGFECVLAYRIPHLVRHFPNALSP
jgi:hypothetical protein